jgi:hypothetical protein
MNAAVRTVHQLRAVRPSGLGFGGASVGNLRRAIAEHRHEIDTDTPGVVSTSRSTAVSAHESTRSAPIGVRPPVRELDVPADGGRTGNRLLLRAEFGMS